MASCLTLGTPGFAQSPRTDPLQDIAEAFVGRVTGQPRPTLQRIKLGTGWAMYRGKDVTVTVDRPRGVVTEYTSELPARTPKAGAAPKILNDAQAWDHAASWAKKLDLECPPKERLEWAVNQPGGGGTVTIRFRRPVFGEPNPERIRTVMMILDRVDGRLIHLRQVSGDNHRRPSPQTGQYLVLTLAVGGAFLAGLIAWRKIRG